MNNKGVTVIELLISFILISIIVVGMMNVLYIYRGEIYLSNYKKEMLDYKNALTKDIYDDILKKRVDNVEKINDKSIKITFVDGSTKNLTISNTNTDNDIRNKHINYGGRVYKIHEELPDDISNLKKYENIKFTSNNIILTKDDLGTDIVYHVDINMNHVDIIEDMGIHLTFIKG